MYLGDFRPQVSVQTRQFDCSLRNPSNVSNAALLKTVSCVFYVLVPEPPREVAITSASRGLFNLRMIFTSFLIRENCIPTARVVASLSKFNVPIASAHLSQGASLVYRV